LSNLDALASGPYLAACALLVVTGVAKLRQPQATAAAVRAAFRFGVPDELVRGFGAVEVAAGVGAAIGGGAAAAAVAVLYAAFVGVALQLRRRAPDANCGCIGARSGHVSAAHIVTSIAAFTVATVYVATGGAGVVAVLRAQPLGGAPFVALTACCTGLAALFLSAPNEERTWLH
jgi:uncharacterized protein YjeT (DUF2065 family)